MKGIELCAECAYYNMKSHKCTRGCEIEPDSNKSEDVRFFADCPLPDVQPVKHGRWITKAKDYYKAWQDSGRSWDDMPYFVTGLKFACSNCFEQYDVNAEGVEKWNGCPLCLARMDGDAE